EVLDRLARRLEGLDRRAALLRRVAELTAMRTRAVAGVGLGSEARLALRAQPLTPLAEACRRDGMPLRESVHRLAPCHRHRVRPDQRPLLVDAVPATDVAARRGRRAARRP